MFNPLYRMLARRAMSDVMAESLILLSAVAGLWAWRKLLRDRPGPLAWLGAVLAGLLGGLAALAKLNGALAMMIVISWAMLAVALPRVVWNRKFTVLVGAFVSSVASLIVFIVLNPFLTAHPRVVSPPSAAIARMSLAQRVRFLADHRLRVSSEQKGIFPHNALETSLEKVKVVLVQGFGRFGVFGPRRNDSTRRIDRAQDWGAVVWLPWVVLGAASLAARGFTEYDSGEPPTAWAILLEAGLALIVVTAYLPLAWDRYFLSLQAGSSLLASAATVAMLDQLRSASSRKPREPDTCGP
jgi:hypothetical protein